MGGKGGKSSSLEKWGDVSHPGKFEGSLLPWKIWGCPPPPNEK